MVLIEEGIEIVEREIQPKKARLPIEYREEGKVTSFRFNEPRKHPFSILFTSSGMTTLSKALHLAKASSPIPSRLAGIFISFRD